MSDCGHKRRTVLKGALGLGLALPMLEARAATDDPRQARPQEGDQFVYFTGERKGEIVTAADLPMGGPQIMVYPKDPATDTVRDGSRLNQVLMIRLEPEQLSKDTLANAAEGVVAYSAACTPDTFVFDGDRRLVYRGRLDDSRPRTDRPVTATDVRAAVAAILAGEPVDPDQWPSVGCGIKWRS